MWIKWQHEDFHYDMEEYTANSKVKVFIKKCIKYIQVLMKIPGSINFVFKVHDKKIKKARY